LHREIRKNCKLIDELKNHEFNLKDERNVNEYLSCFIEESKMKKSLL
jgi:hypothetical protein